MPGRRYSAFRRGMAVLLSALLVLLTAHDPVGAAPPRPAPPIVLVRLATTAGPIVVALEMKRAPVTAGNFLRYVTSGKLDGTTFYRAARSKSRPGVGLIQGGIDHVIAKSFFPIAHEPTSRTGLKHVDGTLSMARNDPGTAMGDFFITIGAAPSLDARPGYPGYAAFGHVVSGMALVHRILALPTWPGGYSRDMMGQTIRDPIRIVSARVVR